MAKVAIEEIEAVRSGERNTYFSAIKGFVLGMVKEGIPSILIGAAAGAAIGLAAWGGMALAGGLGLFGLESAGKAVDLIMNVEKPFGFIGAIAGTSGLLSGALVGVKGAYQEISHARNINGLISQEINNIKGRAQSRSQSVDMGAEAPVTPDYVKKILDAGEQVHPKTQLAKLMQQREEAALSQGEVTLH